MLFLIAIFSCAPGLWPGAQLYILGMSLTAWLSQTVENICPYRCWDSEILHGASLGTLIKIQEEPIWRTMWGPCFGHKRAIFWPFLGKGDYGIHPELWNLALSIPWHMDQDSGRTNLKDRVKTMFWQLSGHILATCGITDSLSGNVEKLGTAVDLWSCFLPISWNKCKLHYCLHLPWKKPIIFTSFLSRNIMHI